MKSITCFCGMLHKRNMRNINAQLSYQMYHINKYWLFVHVEFDGSIGINSFDSVCLFIHIHIY